MSKDAPFPPLNDFEPTRATLHAYSHGVGTIPRAHAQAHPHWYHISLKVRPFGLATNRIAVPDGGHLWLEMDLREHKVRLIRNYGETWSFSMTEGLTSTEFADQLIGAVAKLGLKGEYAREKFESEDGREYDPDLARDYLTALTNANRIFNEHRVRLSGHMGPVQLWPHNFDLAFEWFGTRVETYQEHGETTEFPSQLNLGLYAGGDPYFYSNPWPFDQDKLVDKPLPDGARWHTEGWNGTILPYAELAGDEDGEERLKAFAGRVFEVASPTLLT